MSLRHLRKQRGADAFLADADDDLEDSEEDEEKVPAKKSGFAGFASLMSDDDEEEEEEDEEVQEIEVGDQLQHSEEHEREEEAAPQQRTASGNKSKKNKKRGGKKKRGGGGDRKPSAQEDDEFPAVGDEFWVGEGVQYKGDAVATVLAVHRDDDELYFTIRLRDGTEKQTPLANLTKLGTVPDDEEAPPSNLAAALVVKTTLLDPSQVSSTAPLSHPLPTALMRDNLARLKSKTLYFFDLCRRCGACLVPAWSGVTTRLGGVGGATAAVGARGGAGGSTSSEPCCASQKRIGLA